MLARILMSCALLISVQFTWSQDPGQAGSGLMTIDNYAINTPSWIHMVEGLRSYRHGEFRRAFGRFRLASNWANKHGQAWIGWMYTLGQGVEKDVPRAYAWLKLAAERGYPTFVEDVQALSEAMSPVELAHGELILTHELLPELGDEVAVRRTSMEMWTERMRVTGSRVGYTGRLQRVEHSNLGSFYGGAFYAADRWNFERVIEFETKVHSAMAKTSVELRDLYLPGKIETTPAPGKNEAEKPE